LDLPFDELLEEIFSPNQDENELKVEKFCREVLSDEY
jgi:hypothetical protein